VLVENGFELGTIGEVHFAEGGLRGDRGAMAFEETIEGNDGVAARDQEFAADAADIAGGTGDENIHDEALLEQVETRSVKKQAQNEDKIRAEAGYTRRRN
jgi:hypothetical protein